MIRLLLDDVGGLVAALLLLGLAAAVPPALLVIGDLPLTALQQQWEVSEILFDATDLMLAALAVSLLAHGLPRRRGAAPVLPLWGAWLILGALMSLAYVTAPINAPVLDSPSRVAYQLYRYAWRPIAWFALAALCIRDRRTLAWFAASLVLSGMLFAVPAIAQGYAGEYATGPFTHKNELGAALLAPFLFAVAGAVSGRPRGARWLCVLGTLLIGRGLMFALSRGAVIAALAGAAVLAAGLLADRRLRGAALSLLPVLLVAGVFALLKADSPVMRELLTARAGTEDANMQFRLQERWPHFVAIIAEHPWLGIGDGRDLSLGEDMNTPHNGYLSLALVHGVPVAGLTIGFGAAGLLAAWRLRRAADRDLRVFCLAVAASLVALLVHNLIDATLYNPFASKVYWLLIGVVVLAARAPHLFRFRAAPAAVRAAPLVTAPGAVAEVQP